MSAYVVDASVVIQYAITQEYTPEVRVLIARMYREIVYMCLSFVF